MVRDVTPPYTAVIFTNIRTAGDHGYAAMAAAMESLAARQPGYLGFESARDDDLGIAVSYWETDAHAAAWKRVAAHEEAQRLGREHWYSDYVVRIATVTRQYDKPTTVEP